MTRFLRRLFARKPNVRDNLSLIVEATRNSPAIVQYRVYRAAQVGRRLQAGLDTDCPRRTSIRTSRNEALGGFPSFNRLTPSRLSSSRVALVEGPTLPRVSFNAAATKSLHSTDSASAQGYRAAQKGRA